jgi:transcription elongation factor GreA
MTTYLTQERYDELTNELASLKAGGRQGIAERLKQAKDLGDLSENSEYQEAREEQGLLERRIAELEEILQSSSIIKKAGGTTATVRIGCKVTVKRDGTSTTYSIVGSNEARPAEGFISNESPIGKGLLGKKVGDSVTVVTPSGEKTYTIANIE